MEIEFAEDRVDPIIPTGASITQLPGEDGWFVINRFESDDGHVEIAMRPRQCLQLSESMDEMARRLLKKGALRRADGPPAGFLYM